MKYSESLKKTKDFQNVYRRGKSYANRYLVMYVLSNQTEGNRLGISVSKKVGNSVIRHHLTRLIRESYRLHEDMFNSGLDIVVVARSTAKDISYHEVESALLHLGGLHKIISKEKKMESFSPMKTTKCPYCPTCSLYGLEAVEKYGAIKGGTLALWRIIRCNPFSKGGYDPVP